MHSATRMKKKTKPSLAHMCCTSFSFFFFMLLWIIFLRTKSKCFSLFKTKHQNMHNNSIKICLFFIKICTHVNNFKWYSEILHKTIYHTRKILNQRYFQNTFPHLVFKLYVGCAPFQRNISRFIRNSKWNERTSPTELFVTNLYER